MAGMIPQEVLDRMYKNVYICMRCNARIRTTKPHKTRCRKCGYKKLRPIKRGTKAKKQ